MDTPELLLTNAVAWRAWLEQHHDSASGVFLVLAKKGTTDPTSLRYDEALEEALCFGWIDGKLERRDELTFRQRFTPRTSRSSWSKRNVAIVETLAKQGRMHEDGERAIRLAQESGRWDLAYEGQANMPVPDDLAKVLDTRPLARRAFENLTKANRYSIIYRIETVKRAETRQRHIENFVAMLERGETPHPQKKNPLD